MKKNVKKIVISLIIMIFCINIYSATIATSSLEDFDGKITNFGDIEDVTTVKEIISTIIYIVKLIGTYLSVIVLIIVGMKYIVGSVEEKAEYKKTLIPYIVGAVLVFGSTNIVGVIYDSITKTS